MKVVIQNEKIVYINIEEKEAEIINIKNEIENKKEESKVKEETLNLKEVDFNEIIIPEIPEEDEEGFEEKSMEAERKKQLKKDIEIEIENLKKEIKEIDRDIEFKKELLSEREKEFKEYKVVVVEDDFFNNLPASIWLYKFKIEKDKLIVQNKEDVEISLNIERYSLIDKQTQEKIISKYPEHKQANLQRETSRILGEMVVYQRKPTTEEMKVLAEAKESDDFIKLCIQEGKEKKALINNA